ncbi:c-type cytochrome biogenesis protein CcsB [Amnibacterium kyonggiense]|uniref:Cytochrome c-type biogenesis protein CcsB n=1 Tax=Amnibacterium kyonggiense TaxID=595671 RepID=A0A4R7FPZ4_9MICO|nr:c-type cytochrome biogenesis protein CcsB [Amnibacterium kyonggiense]TDS79649.1 cytochrome c-type biogenesis protein CcsB [Amnibacterium kyonggiense]
MVNPLDQISELLLISAIAVYLIAFVAFALDLARRSAESQAKVDLVRAGSAEVERSAGGGTAVLVAAPPAPPEAPVRDRRPAARTGIALMLVGAALHLGAAVLRGVAAGRVPWANMYEFAMTGTLIMVLVFLVALTRIDLRFLGAVIAGFVVVLLGIATVSFHVAVSPLPPALQSYWLVLHVLVAMLGTGFFTLAAALSVAQLLQVRRRKRAEAGRGDRLRLLATIPDADRLENLAYRISVVGFILWTFTLIAGAIWANHAWGRYWGWDTKEVWTFIIWVVYAGYLHARATLGWRGTGSAWLNLIGYACILFNFGVVNVFFHGLHSYSGLPTSPS